MDSCNEIHNKDITLEFIRDELREEICSSRKEQRYAKVNKNRIALGKLMENSKSNEELVVTLTKSLRKKALNIEDYSTLQNSLIMSETHIKAFFKNDNAVQGLVRDLSGTSSQSKLAAANCCCNLALGNSKACTTLSKFIAPYLIAELESTSQPLAEVCAWTIGNLVSESKKSFSILHAQGCMKSLMNLARQCSDELLPAVSYASLRYIHTGIDSIESEDILKFAEIMLTRYPTVSDADTMWLLAILSSIPECINLFIKQTSNIYQYLYEAVCNANEDFIKISAALRIICNTISEPSGQVAHDLFKNGIDNTRTFLDKLLSHMYVHIRQETLWLIGNLLNHGSKPVQEIIKPIVFSLPSLNLAVNFFNK